MWEKVTESECYFAFIPEPEPEPQPPPVRPALVNYRVYDAVYGYAPDHKYCGRFYYVNGRFFSTDTRAADDWWEERWMVPSDCMFPVAGGVA